MKNLLLPLFLIATLLAACAPQDDLVPPAPPSAPEAENLGGQAWLVPDDFANSESLRARFAPPYDVWQDNWYLLNVPWDGVRGEPAYLQHTFSEYTPSNARLIYSTAYVRNAQTMQWRPLQLEGTSSKYTGFLKEANLASIPASYLGVGDNYVASYVCTQIVQMQRGGKSTFACGCSEPNLESCGKWNVQRLTVHETPVCGDGKCSIGENPWTCEEDCLEAPEGPTNLTDGGIEVDRCVVTGGMSCAEWMVSDDHLLLTLRNNLGNTVTVTNITAMHTDTATTCVFRSTDFTLGADEQGTFRLPCSPSLPVTGVPDEFSFTITYKELGSTWEHQNWGYLRSSERRNPIPLAADHAVLVVNGREYFVNEASTQLIQTAGNTFEVTALAITYDKKVKLVVNGFNLPALAEGSSADIDGTTFLLREARLSDDSDLGNMVEFKIWYTPPGGAFEQASQDIVREGETKTYSLEGKEYEISALVITDNQRAKFLVNGMATDSIGVGERDSIESISISVEEILVDKIGSSTGLVEFTLGSQAITIIDSTDNGAFDGSVEMGGEHIEDLKAEVDYSQDGEAIESIRLRLMADAALRSGIYMSGGQGLRAQLDEPEGMLGDWDVTLQLSDTASGPRLGIVSIGDSAAQAPLKVAYAQKLNAAKPIISESDFRGFGASILSSGTLQNSQVAQTLVFETGTDPQHSTIDVMENSNDENGVFLYFKDGEPIYTYTAKFTPELRAREPQQAFILGDWYELRYSTADVTLHNKAISDTLRLGETKSYGFDDKEYEVAVLAVGPSPSGQMSAKFLINGEATDALVAGQSDTLSDGMVVTVREVLV